METTDCYNCEHLIDRGDFWYCFMVHEIIDRPEIPCDYWEEAI